MKAKVDAVKMSTCQRQYNFFTTVYEKEMMCAARLNQGVCNVGFRL